MTDRNTPSTVESHETAFTLDRARRWLRMALVFAGLAVLVEPAAAQSAGSAFCGTDMAQTIQNIFTLIQFVSARLDQVEGSTVTTGDVYDAYMEWAEARDVPVESKDWFARRLGDHIAFERTSEYRDGETVRCYDGIALTEENQ